MRTRVSRVLGLEIYILGSGVPGLGLALGGFPDSCSKLVGKGRLRSILVYNILGVSNIGGVVGFDIRGEGTTDCYVGTIF